MKKNGARNGGPGNGLLQLFSDGSFQPHDGNRAGGAALWADGNGRRQGVLAIQFDSASALFPIRESVDAECLMAMHALEAMDAHTVGLFGSDCMGVVPRLEDIQRGRLNARKYNGPVFERLDHAVRRQPMTVRHFPRSAGGMPVANAFAQAAARGDIAKMEAESRRFRVPFTFIAADGSRHAYGL